MQCRCEKGELKRKEQPMRHTRLSASAVGIEQEQRKGKFKGKQDIKHKGGPHPRSQRTWDSLWKVDDGSTCASFPYTTPPAAVDTDCEH